MRPSYPFSHVGVDYAGPIHLRTAPGRGHKSMKGYIVVSVCFSTKAVHLDTVTSYDANSFIQALKRFVSVRGMCSDIYSDCGTNFIDANKVLK